MDTANKELKIENDEKKIKLSDNKDNSGVNNDYYNYYYSQYNQVPTGGYWNGAQNTGQAPGYSFPNEVASRAYYDYCNAYYSQASLKGYPYGYPTTTSQAPSSSQAQAEYNSQWYLQNGYNYSNPAQTGAYQYPNYTYPAQPVRAPATYSGPSQPISSVLTSTAKKIAPPNPPIPNIPPPAPPSSKLPNNVSSIASTSQSTVGKPDPSIKATLPTSFQSTHKGFKYAGSSEPGLKRPLYTAADTSKPVFGRSLLDTNSHQKPTVSSTNYLSSNNVSKSKKHEGSTSERDTTASRTFTVGEKSLKKFPLSLKLYIENVYKKFPDLSSNPLAHKILADEISKASSAGTLWTTDWKNYPIPSPILQLTKVTYKPKAFATKNKTTKKDTAPKSSETDSDLDQGFKRPLDLGPNELKRLESRKLRFSASNVPAKPFPIHVPSLPPVNRDDVIDWDEHTVVGTCTIPEKRFFRLTSAPDPSAIRPLHVLKDWSEKLLIKWQETKDYGYVLDQFQAVRQDLTVQRIKNSFTVHVYESVGRLCLEKGDLGEFNKCQTQLIELYKYKIPGNPNEFIAYRILYYLHTRNQSDINLTLTGLTPEEKSDKAIKHALQLREAMSSANYIKFFQLYKSTPNLGHYLINQFLERERMRFLNIICSVFRQTISVSYIQTSLGFNDIPECVNFLKDLSVNIISNNNDHGADAQKSLRIETRAECAKVQAKYNSLNRVDLKGQLNQ